MRAIETILIFAISISLIGTAYAATEVSVFLPINKQWDDHRCIFNFYQDTDSGIPKGQSICSWDWTFLLEATEFIPDPEGAPTFEEYEKALIDYLNGIEEKTPAEIIEEFAEVEPEVPQWQKALEAKKLERAEELSKLEKLLKDCEAIKERWSKIQDSDYIGSLGIPKSMFAIDDYASAGKEGDFNKMYEVCRGMIVFEPQLAALENKIVDAEAVFLTPSEVELLHLEHEQKKADAVQAKIDEAAKWEAWKCEPQQVERGFCKEHLKADPFAKGFRTDEAGNVIGTDCGYYYTMIDIGKRKQVSKRVDFCISDFQKIIDEESLTLEQQEELSKHYQCEEYMPHYEHKDVIPKWLSHCEGYRAELLGEEQTEDCPDCKDIEEPIRTCYIRNVEVDCKEKYGDGN